MIIATILLALAPVAPTSTPPAELQHLATAMRGAAAWKATFTQTYTPSGFDEGTSDAGTVVVAPPGRLRFDYLGAEPRVFAVDEGVARQVDPGAGSCDAFRLDGALWDRLPLAALLDPAATVKSFDAVAVAGVLRLTPREPSPELASIEVTVGPSGLPATVVVRDGEGNRNLFSFSGWVAVAVPPAASFAPALPGKAPCRPEGP
jgi:outer membrane lipoprotein-sorting protein